MIKLTGIHKTYVLDSGEEVKALRGIDLEIKDGEIFGVIGLSGAGKSTLIRIINMLERPTSGKVEVNGVDLTSLSERKLREERSKIGMIFQQFNLLSSLTVAQNVAFPLTLGKKKPSAEEQRRRVMELLKMVGLEDKADVYPSQLSGGQKQRVGIARALATNPKILLCDEATSALDPKTTASILKLLTDLRDRLGLTLVIITHQMEVIKECCDRVAVLDGGVISEIGTTLEIFSDPKKDLTKRLVASAVRRDVQDLLEQLRFHKDYEDGDGLVVEMLFLGAKANDPVIVDVARETGAAISIIGGSINHIQKEPLGILVVKIAGDRATIDKAFDELKRRVLRITVFGYNGRQEEA
jgi:D-methionine transport system ATP-binding protein